MQRNESIISPSVTNITFIVNFSQMLTKDSF